MDTNPALAEVPADEIAPGEARSRLAVALAVYGGEMAEADRIKYADALAKASPVDCVVSVYDLLCEVTMADVFAETSTLGPVLRSRFCEVSDLIGRHSWHGKGDAALAVSAALRASLAA